ncbi:hypothetical protein DFJ73DRAFT_781160 [Zopfochytrium polystomum]|nr:hypothetical protein DFJ73DRAFT_781160 [Zopfochytrium polystomum]
MGIWLSDGVKLICALTWSVLDNNEFGSYADQYGLQYVNRSSPGLERRFKHSFFDIVDFFHEDFENAADNPASPVASRAEILPPRSIGLTTD